MSDRKSSKARALPHRAGHAGAQGRGLGRALLCLFAASLLGGLAPPAADVAGFWKIDGKLAGHRISLICRFERRDAALTGPCFGDGTIAKGTVNDAGATWAWKSDGHVLTFEGKLQPDGRLAGAIKTPIFPGVDISGEFTAQRPVTDESEANPPQGMEALSHIVRDFAHGRLKEERFTEAPAGQLRSQMDALTETYKALGSMHSLTFVDRLPDPPADRSTEIYELEFAKGKQVCSVDVTAETKIADLICKAI